METKMLRMLTFAALVAIGSPTLSKTPSCKPLPGFEQVLGRPGIRYIMIGEYHGTVEMPEIAADAACHAAATGRPLVFGVELTPEDQPSIDRFMRSNGGSRARSALVASPGWKEDDNRATAAVADMIEALRRLGKRHPVTVIAFDVAREPSDTSAKREAAMADALKVAAETMPNAIVVALTGSGHADKEGFTSRKPPFLAAAGRLPAEQTVSLTFARPGGRYWGCQSPTGDRSNGCTAYDMPVREPVAPRGIVLDPKLRGGFDGIYVPGKQYSASRPAIARGRPEAVR
jgi:hypothetical protein